MGMLRDVGKKNQELQFFVAYFDFDKIIFYVPLPVTSKCHLDDSLDTESFAKITSSPN